MTPTTELVTRRVDASPVHHVDDPEEDLILARRDRYMNHLSQKMRDYLDMLMKDAPDGTMIPLGTLPLTERQEFIMLRELARGAMAAEGEEREPPPRVQAFIADPEAQARLIELARTFMAQAVAEGSLDA